MTALSPNPAAVEVSVVLCTYNRAVRLGDALAALVDQVDAPPYEVVVVDNNSSDDTPAVIARFASSGVVRAVAEPTQGLSHARNRGVAVAGPTCWPSPTTTSASDRTGCGRSRAHSRRSRTWT